MTLRIRSFQNAKKILTSLLFLALFTGSGIGVGLGVGYAVTVFQHEGLFSSWRHMDSLLNFIEIVDVTTSEIWAKSDNGKLYLWESNCYRDIPCNRWIYPDILPGDEPESWGRPMLKADSCENLDFKFRFQRNPPEEVIECARGWVAGPEFGVLVYYALLENGDIWEWKYSNSMIGDFYIGFCSTSAGLILGIVVGFVIMGRRKKKLG